MRLAMMYGISNRIKQVRKSAGLTQATFADRLGVTAQAVSAWERGGSITNENLRAICATFEVNLDWLATGKEALVGNALKSIDESQNRRIQFARVIGEIGGGGWYETSPFGPTQGPGQADDKYQPVPFVLEKTSSAIAHFALRVVGNSMNKIVPSGSFVICIPYDSMRSGIADGDLVAVEKVKSGLYSATLKRVRRSPAGWELWPESNDPQYKPIRLDTDLEHDAENLDIVIHIIGLVVGIFTNIGPAL